MANLLWLAYQRKPKGVAVTWGRRTAWGQLGDSFESPSGESGFHSIDNRKPLEVYRMALSLWPLPKITLSLQEGEPGNRQE